MLPFRRAIVLAAFFITAFILIRRAHSPEAPNPIRKPPPRPATPNSGGDGALHHAPSTSNPAHAGVGDYRDKPTSSSQNAIQDLSKMSLYDKLAYQYPYDVETKFPAYIWQTWKNTPEDDGFDFRDEEGSWTYHHPGFVHEVITDQVAVHVLRLLYAPIPEILEAYDALPKPVLKADFFRYLILLARGGIYSDIDTYALKSALDWLPDTVPQKSVGLVIGIEADPDRPDWKDWYSRRIQFCQWTIQAKPGHPVLRDIVSRITAETLKRKKEGTFITKEKSIVEFTGPAIWTDTIFDYFNDPRYFDMKRSPGEISYRNFTGMEKPRKVGDVVVLPITSFSPGVQQMGAKDIDDPMAFVKHDFEGTWKPESERHIGQVQ
ncbi:initiation-specific alpha-1,6-mannosyltransferase [Xylaria sp. FL0933]|nr:initiation-specific alpha-1,6-mannosyltransferase [Xylaria sp. FL0933]